MPVADFAKRKKELVTAAKETVKKTKNINIRLTQFDLDRLKAKAIEEGLPYQTFAASILHKHIAFAP
jgi:predicted DNA binding CopG/RHH family protein